jgi:cytochrome c-type biogenesis protein CcmH/NrfF
MTIAIIILAYIANIFLNRWSNKIAYKKGCSEIALWTWFIPIACTIAMIILIVENVKIKDNWFTGKNW